MGKNDVVFWQKFQYFVVAQNLSVKVVAISSKRIFIVHEGPQDLRNSNGFRVGTSIEKYLIF